MKRCFSLSPRLQTVADLVPSGKTLADIGSDHGQLPVWLLLHKQIPSAIATDLRPGPLSRAKQLATRWGLSAEQIDFRLCNGLSAIRSCETETIIIAGMGGETIADILCAAPWTNEGKHTFILQAMSGMDGLRRYLSANGFKILQEILVEEGKTLYVVVQAVSGEMKPLTEGEIWVGRQTQEMVAPLRSRYLEQELNKLRRAVIGLEHSQRSEDQEKKKWYELAAWEVAEMKKEWDQWQQ